MLTAVTLDHGNLHVLCINVYMSCDYHNGSRQHRDSLANVLVLTESVADMYSGCKCIVLGDFNFECSDSRRGYREFLPLMRGLDLLGCSSMDSSSLWYTYS